MTVRIITDEAEKKDISSQILGSLPDRAYASKAVASCMEQNIVMPFIAAFDNDTPVAFLAIMYLAPMSAEIHVMEALPQYRRKDIGEALVASFIDCCKERRLNLLYAKPIDNHPNENYEKICHFYSEMGFIPFDLWAAQHDVVGSCDVMAMRLYY